ncbi:MAG: hypothetical protein V3U45_07965 [bacterium]
MTIEQARKMVAGTLKGDSAMAQAMKELISGEAAPPSPEDLPTASSDRGVHTLARMRGQQDEGGF